MPKKRKRKPKVDPELVKAVAWMQTAQHTGGCLCRPCEAARRVMLDAGMWREVNKES